MLGWWMVLASWAAAATAIAVVWEGRRIGARCSGKVQSWRRLAD
jgi:hypothetical protein